MSASEFHNWVWDGGRRIDGDLSGPAIVHALKDHRDAVAVVEIGRSVSAKLAKDEHLGLDDLAVEDLQSDDERSRMDVLGETLVVLTRTADFDTATGDLTHRPIGFLVTDRLFAVIEDDSEFGRYTQVVEKACATIAVDGTAGLLHAVLDSVVDGYSTALRAIEDESDRLAEELFNDHPLGRAGQLQAFRLRRALTALRRITEPMRDVAGSLLSAADRDDPVNDPTSSDTLARLIPGSTARRFADLSNHIDHAADGVDGQRDVLSSLYETSLSLADVRLNMIMKKLSGWAAIIAVPTLITGFLGMNVPYPGFGQPAGVIAAVVLIAAAAVTLYLVFRRKGWL